MRRARIAAAWLHAAVNVGAANVDIFIGQIAGNIHITGNVHGWRVDCHLRRRQCDRGWGMQLHTFAAESHILRRQPIQETTQIKAVAFRVRRP